MDIQHLEIALILGLIAWQAFIFIRNRALIQRVRDMYPNAAQLGVETTEMDDPQVSALSGMERILQGAVSFHWADHPNQEFAVADTKDNHLLVISRWDASLRQWQPFTQVTRSVIITRIQNQAIQRASELSDPLQFDALTVSDPTTEFDKIIAVTNDYLRANKGAAADFNALRDISEREAELLDAEIEAQISSPLYLGLLGTFAGAILGLLVLVNPFGDPAPTATAEAAGFNNADVTHFLGGVLIAMVGSLCGLGFTLWGNQLLKSARATRDRLKNDYYNFLQKALLPKLNSDMQQSMSVMRDVLKQFNEDFFSKIQTEFLARIADLTPLIGSITENISIQKDFLEKLQTIGYTQLANATIKVFDRVDQSAATFEKFMGYQQALNVSVEKGAQTAYTISALLDRLSSLEQALNQVPTYLQKHDEFVDSQVRIYTQHTQLLDTMRDGIHQGLTKDAAKMYEVLENRLSAFHAEAQTADDQWKKHFHQLNENNIYQKIVEYLTPFQQLPAQQQQLNKLQEEQARRNTQALQALQEPLEQNRRIQEQLLLQTERTNTILARFTEPTWFQRTILGRKPRTLTPTK